MEREPESVASERQRLERAAHALAGALVGALQSMRRGADADGADPGPRERGRERVVPLAPRRGRVRRPRDRFGRER
jgi:hypothetical protein